MILLSTDRVSISFGAVHAVDMLSLEVEEGLVFSIIGPNGAGKTTLFNIISGLYLPDEGRILFAGEDVTGMAPEHLARRGLSRTFQNLQIFFRMTALENVMVGRHRHEASGLIADLLHLPAVLRQNRRTRDEALAALQRVGLAAMADRPAGGMSYGGLKRLEIARALASEPKVLLLDEPAAGLDTAESRHLGERLRAIVDAGTTVLLVDHDMDLVLNVCDLVHVIEGGRHIASGSPDEIRSHDRVAAAYLGIDPAESAGEGVRA
jgi:branched-chain amino acid transport system ATP-binding protein